MMEIQRHGLIELRVGDLVAAIDRKSFGKEERMDARVWGRVPPGFSKGEGWFVLKAVMSNKGEYEELPSAVDLGDLIFCRRCDIIFISRSAAYRSGDLVRHPENGRGVVRRIDFGLSPDQDVALVDFCGIKRVVLVRELTRTDKADSLPPPLPDHVEIDHERRKKLPSTIYEEDVHY